MLYRKRYKGKLRNYAITMDGKLANLLTNVIYDFKIFSEMDLRKIEIMYEYKYDINEILERLGNITQVQRSHVLVLSNPEIRQDVFYLLQKYKS